MAFSDIDRSSITHALRVILVMFAMGLWIPILLPWDGPPQPFIRWHSYSLPGELLWRGTFACFSVCNLLTALDPAGVGAGYTTFMAAQGLLHGGIMLIDNRIASSKNGLNGNPEHIWSEIPFFILLGLVLGVLLAQRLRPKSAKYATIMNEMQAMEIVQVAS